MKKFCKYLVCFSFLLISACAVNTNLFAAKSNVLLGMLYLQQGDIKLAKYKFSLALQQAPHDSVVLTGVAYFWDSVREISIANYYYAKAIQMYPKQGSIHNNYGAFLCRHGNYKKAIQQFLLATQDINYLHTKEAYANAGKCALKIPDKVLAEQYFKRAINSDPAKISVKLK